MPAGQVLDHCRTHWGDTISAADANWNRDANQTEDVGQYPANPWGFFDIHGNVREWTVDWLRYIWLVILRPILRVRLRVRNGSIEVDHGTLRVRARNAFSQPKEPAVPVTVTSA